MVFKRTDALEVIADGLGWIKMSCELRGLLKLFDNNVVAQRFFCQLLNAAFDLCLGCQSYLFTQRNLKRIRPEYAGNRR